MQQDQFLIMQIVMGIVLFAASISATIPQLFSLKKTRNSSGISLISYIIGGVDNLFWVVWTLGYYFNSMLMYEYEMTRLFQASLLVLVFSNLFACGVFGAVAFVKFKYAYQAKKLKITELQLSKILLAKDKKKYFIDNRWSKKRYLNIILFLKLNLIVVAGVILILYFFAYLQPDGSKEWVWVIITSCICGGIFEAMYWPQVIKSIKYKDMTGISLFWCIFNTLNCVIGFGYDLSLSVNTGKFNYDVIFILVFNGIIANLIILILKLINITKAKKMGMTELEYTKKYLIKKKSK